MRHGQSALNESLDFRVKREFDSGPFKEKNVSLTDIGILQSEQVGRYLRRHFKFDVCFCSPFTRAEETAGYVLEQCNPHITLIRDVRLSEKKFGDLYGFTACDIRRQYPGQFQKREQLGKYWYRPPNGENYEDVRFRVKSFFENLLNQYDGENALVVTHQVPYKMILAEIMGLNCQEVEKLDNTPNCGLYVMKYNSGRFDVHKSIHNGD